MVTDNLNFSLHVFGIYVIMKRSLKTERYLRFQRAIVSANYASKIDLTSYLLELQMSPST